MGVLGTSSGPLEEQGTLLTTEPSIQSKRNYKALIQSIGCKIHVGFNILKDDFKEMLLFHWLM